MQKPKLLIVEDGENIQLSMKWALAQDYEVFLAGDRDSRHAALQEGKTAPW